MDEMDVPLKGGARAALKRREKDFEWLDELLSHVVEGEDFEFLCKSQGLTAGAVLTWIKGDKERQAKLDEARKLASEKHMMEVVSIADNKEGESGRDKLKIDTRFRLAGKLIPEKYGERVEVSGNADRPLLGFGDRQTLLIETARTIQFMLAEAGRRRDGEVVDAEEVVPRLGVDEEVGDGEKVRKEE